MSAWCGKWGKQSMTWSSRFAEAGMGFGRQPGRHLRVGSTRPLAPPAHSAHAYGDAVTSCRYGEPNGSGQST